MENNLRETLKASLKSLEKEREEVLENDKKIMAEVIDDPEELDSKTTENDYSEEEIEEKTANIEINEPETDPQPELEALAHWSKDKKEIFKNLNPEAQEFLLSREKEFNADYTKKTQSLAEERKIAEKYKKSISPHEEYLKSRGLDPYEAANNIIAFERALATASPKERAKMLQELASQYEADFTQDDEEEEVDPRYERLSRKQQEIENYIARQEQERKHKEDREAANIVHQFVNTKDAHGKLKYPHFDKIQGEMSKRYNYAHSVNEPITLEEAYELAVLSNKDLREDYLSNYHGDKTRIEKDKRRFDAAKAASFSVKSSGGGIKSAPTNLTVREALKRAMADANA